MELFYSEHIDGTTAILTPEESAHCCRVMRHRAGDKINVFDGLGTMYECNIVDDNPKKVVVSVEAVHPHWHSHPYVLEMAVCPTKNNDRFEWFVEKATEMGLDSIVAVIGEHSERKVYKSERAAKVALSAAKQSLKASVPAIPEAETVKGYIRSCNAAYKFIAYCFEDSELPRRSFSACIYDLLTDCKKNNEIPSISVLVGPEGDFSTGEAELALKHGFIPVHFGDSRLRTETAALFAVSQVYGLSTLYAESGYMEGK